MEGTEKHIKTLEEAIQMLHYCSLGYPNDKFQDEVFNRFSHEPGSHSSSQRSLYVQMTGVRFGSHG